jgi:hypothetical protein
VTQSANFNTKTIARTTASITATKNILPPVRDTDLIQVPPVPTDPFVAPPVAVAPAPPASKPMTVGLGANQIYQVNCVLPGGGYCSFTNSYFVAPGSTCHCGAAAGTSEYGLWQIVLPASPIDGSLRRVRPRTPSP